METIWLNRRSEIRAGWRILAYGGLAAPLILAVLVASTVPSGNPRLFTPEIVLVYGALCAAAILPALLMFRRVEKRPAGYLGFARHARFRVELGQGLAQGFLLVTLIFLIGWGAGWLRVSWPVSMGLSLIRQAGFYFAHFALAAAFEELLWHGYAFQALVQGAGKINAVAISAALFGIAHLANPHADPLGILNTILAGIWLSLAYLRTRSLWLPTSLHTAWNFSQGFVYGFPVSGLVCPETILKASPQGPAWILGGAFGPEAGGLVTAALLAATFYLAWNRGIQPAQDALALWHPAETES